MSSAVAAPEFVRPRHLWVPPHYSSGGAEAVDLAAQSGLILDPWQAWSLEQMLVEREDGTAAAFEAALIVARQNGKGSCLEALVLSWLFLDEVDLVLWSAHEFKTAAEAFRRMRVLLQGAPDLWSQVARITTANGDEAIELTTGQRLKFVARSKASGRGFSGDKIILDEAYDLDGDQIAALIPTLATVPNPQIIYTSSAGMADSHVLRAVRERALAGGDPALAWLEWCATPSGKDDKGRDVYDFDDREQWRAGNPGYGVRISEAFIAREQRTMSGTPEKWLRERLGVWDDPDSTVRPISDEDWRGTCVPADRPAPTGRLVFVLDVSPGMRSAAISVNGFVGGVPHSELADAQPGTDWVVARLKELKQRNPTARFAVDATGSAPSLMPAASKAGVDLEPLGGKDMQAGAAHLEKISLERSWTHTEDPVLDTAFAAAVKRDIGDSGWDWGRRKATGDIAPLRAVTGGQWLLEKHRVDDYDLMNSAW